MRQKLITATLAAVGVLGATAAANAGYYYWNGFQWIYICNNVYDVFGYFLGCY